MDKMKVRKLLVDHPKVSIGFDYINQTISLHEVENGKLAVNEDIDTFSEENYIKKRTYWMNFMRKYGKEFPQSLLRTTFQEGKKESLLFLEQFNKEQK